MVVELDDISLTASESGSSSPTQVPAKTILKSFPLNPRLKLVYEVMHLGLPERQIKQLIATHYPNLRKQKFTKSQCEKFLAKVVRIVWN